MFEHRTFRHLTDEAIKKNSTTIFQIIDIDVLIHHFYPLNRSLTLKLVNFK